MLILILLMWFASLVLFVITATAQRAPSRRHRRRVDNLMT